MCGISGIFARGDQPVHEGRLRAMRDDQVHRGPDDSGLWTGPHIGLAFNRLAVIDLSPQSSQPMSSEDRLVWIVFNGEIYNFRDLRRDLKAKGHRFRTQGDTEIIVKGYLEWGLDVVPRLNGMFAFALWDDRRETLHLVRDRVGKKPLFYRDSEGEVVFASEIRALLKGLKATPRVDPQALDAYLHCLCVPGEMSIFEGVRKVPPASILTCNRSGLVAQRYWTLSFRRKEALHEGEAIEKLDALLEDATRRRMISDVPLGAFLSGGVDSSTVVAMMSRTGGTVRTFSVGFSVDRVNELPHARAVAGALGTRHEELHLEADAASILPRLVWHYGEPFADASAVPTYYVSRAARQRVTVVLNGDGGDEAFAGYPWARTVKAVELYQRLVPGAVRHGLLRPAGTALSRLPFSIGPLRSLSRLLTEWSDKSAADIHWLWPGFSGGERTGLYHPDFRARLDGYDPRRYCHDLYLGTDGHDDLDRALQVLTRTYLPDDLLVKVDIASMACSLEARSPLLDHRVLEFAASLPSSLKCRGWRTKYILKKLAARLVPPATVYRPKQGFALPLVEWLRGSLRRPLEILLGHERFRGRRLLDPARVQDLLDRHQRGEDHSPKLWTLLWLELWFRMFVDRDLQREDSLADLT